ncbi:MAG: agmatinase [Lutispora sp.]|nr:agmatinase [Lutispora sp.]
MENLYKDPKIWARLNRPDISIEDADAVIFGIPYDEGVSFRSGAAKAPDELRKITYTIDPTTERFESFEGMNILDLGNFEGKNIPEIACKMEDSIKKCIEAKKLFTMIGGDHSTTIPVLQCIDKSIDGSLGIIHLDSHFDLCDEMDGDIYSHGCTQRRSIELKHTKGLDSIFFLGLRSIELQEHEFIKDKNINLLSAREISEIGIKETCKRVLDKMSLFDYIYITVDIDCLDPAYAPGTGTPQFGGLTSRELLDMLYEFFKLPIIGVDIVEVAPPLESSSIALFAARKIVTECWGHYIRKTKGFEV